MIRISDLTISSLRKGKFPHQLPEFYQLRNVVENFPPWHYQESVYDHTLAVLCEERKIYRSSLLSRRQIEQLQQKPFSEYSRQDLLHLASVFHDVGKLKTFVQNPETEKTSCAGHEEKGAEMTREILSREFIIRPEEVQRVSELIAQHGNFCAFSRRQNTFQCYGNLRQQFPEIFLEMVLIELADTRALPDSDEKSWMIDVYKKLLKKY